MRRLCIVGYSFLADQIEGGGIYCGSRGITEWSKMQLSSSYGESINIHGINKDGENLWTPEFLQYTLPLKEFEEINILFTGTGLNKMKDTIKCANSKGEYVGFRNYSPCSDLFIGEQGGTQWKDSSQILINISADSYFIHKLNSFLNYINELLTSKLCPKGGSGIYK